MPDRTYNQYCGVARALDLVGERWALLVVRELVLGGKRFTDLKDGLPGIGTNVLATRLRQLEADGIVEKLRLAPPAATTIYVLTVYGRRGRAGAAGARPLGRGVDGRAAAGAGDALRVVRGRADRILRRGGRRGHRRDDPPRHPGRPVPARGARRHARGSTARMHPPTCRCRPTWAR